MIYYIMNYNNSDNNFDNNSDYNSILYKGTIISYVIFSILLLFICSVIFICKIGDLANYKKKLNNTEMNENISILNKKPPSYNSINEYENENENESESEN